MKVFAYFLRYRRPGMLSLYLQADFPAYGKCSMCAQHETFQHAMMECTLYPFIFDLLKKTEIFPLERGGGGRALLQNNYAHGSKHHSFRHLKLVSTSRQWSRPHTILHPGVSHQMRPAQR